MHLEAYLRRIRYTGPVSPTFDVLCALQTAHVCSVPFENLDVQLGHKLTTDIEPAYEKIVARERGGWCFEQNGLFGWALAEIGFDVTRVAASVMRHERGESSNANHLCLLVLCEDAEAAHLADVGFGGSLIKPIALAEAEYYQDPFQLGLRRLDDGFWQFWENAGDGEFSFDFMPDDKNEAAMAHRCEFLQTDPASGFVQNLVVERRTLTAHLCLRGRVLSIARSAGIETRLIETADELVTTLGKQFRLDIPEAVELWPRITSRHEEYLREQA